jgi:hypothetical protein
MGFLLHRPVKEVCATSGPDNNGYTEFWPPRTCWLDSSVELTPHGRKWLWDYTLIAISGYLTQKTRFPDTPDGSMGPDLRRANELALRACDGDAGRVREYAENAAREFSSYVIQDSYWLLVESLAHALIPTGFLRGPDIRRILKAASTLTASL